MDPLVRTQVESPLRLWHSSMFEPQGSSGCLRMEYKRLRIVPRCDSAICEGQPSAYVTFLRIRAREIHALCSLGTHKEKEQVGDVLPEARTMS